MTASIVDRPVGHQARFDGTPAYAASAAKTREDEVIAQALKILERRMHTASGCGQPALSFSSPTVVRAYLQLQLGDKDHEEFGVLFVDAQNRMIAFEAMFRGTLTQTSVYPREIVKAALAHNAAAVFFSHNHPSGTTTPSRADEALTHTLKAALALVDVRVLDHIIVTSSESLSMAERGLL